MNDPPASSWLLAMIFVSHDLALVAEVALRHVMYAAVRLQQLLFTELLTNPVHEYTFAAHSVLSIEEVAHRIPGFTGKCVLFLLQKTPNRR